MIICRIKHFCTVRPLFFFVGEYCSIYRHEFIQLLLNELFLSESHRSENFCKQHLILTICWAGQLINKLENFKRKLHHFALVKEIC